MKTEHRFALTCSIGALAFWNGFGLRRFYDDWVFAEAATRALHSGAIGAYIWQPLGQHWSPLWQAFDLLNVSAVGWESDRLVRSVTLVLVMAGVGLFLRTAGRLGIGATAAAFGAFTFGLHPLNAILYYSFDTCTQSAVDLASWAIAAAALSIGFEVNRRKGSVLPLILTAGYVLALLAKEEALSALAAVTTIAVWFHVVEPAADNARRALRLTWFNMMMATAAFAVLRAWSGVPASGDGAFRLCVTCVPANVGTLLGGAMLPVPSMPVYFALIDPQLHPVLVMGVVVLMAAVGAGLWGGIRRLREHGRRSDARRAGLFLALWVASTFPTALLAHVGELYAHTGLFWLAMLMATAAEGWGLGAPRRSAARDAAGGFVAAAYVVMLLVGLRWNLSGMRANGERAAALLDRFQVAIRNVPVGSTVVVRGLDTVKGPADYSLYRLTTPGMLLMSAHASLHFVTDDRIALLDEEQPLADQKGRPSGRTFVAAFEGDAVSVTPLTEPWP